MQLSTWRGLRKCDRTGQVAGRALQEGPAEDRRESDGTNDRFQRGRAGSTRLQVVPEVRQCDPRRDDFPGLAKGACLDPVHDHSHGSAVASGQHELSFDFDGLLIAGLQESPDHLLPIDRRRHPHGPAG